MYIDDVVLENETVTVTVFESQEAEGHSTEIINLTELQKYAEGNGLLSWLCDYAGLNGAHIQEAGVTPFEEAVNDYDILLQVSKEYILSQLKIV